MLPGRVPTRATPLTEPIPMASPGPRATRSSRRSRRCCDSGPALARPARARRSRRRSRRRVGRAHACAVSSGTAGLHLGAARRRRRRRATRSSRRPFSFIASANVDPLRARHARLRRHRPGHALHPRRRRRRRGHRAHDRRSCPCHIFGTACDVAGMERSACRSSRTPRGARRALRDGTPSAPRHARLRLLPQQADDDGGGRRRRHRTTPAVKERIDSERNQGRAPDMGWLDHDRLGFNYRLTDIACAIGLVQLKRLDGMLADRAPGRRALPRGAAPSSTGRAARRRRARGSSTSSAAARRRPRRDDPRAARARASRPSPTCPRSTCSPSTASLRLPRGRVPGRRGRRRALARAAVLPADDRGPGRAASPRRSARPASRRYACAAPSVSTTRPGGHDRPALRAPAARRRARRATACTSHHDGRNCADVVDDAAR